MFRLVFIRGVRSQRSLSIMLFDGDAFKEPNYDIVQLPPTILSLPPYLYSKTNAWAVCHDVTVHRSVAGPIKSAAYLSRGLPSVVRGKRSKRHSPFREEGNHE